MHLAKLYQCPILSRFCLRNEILRCDNKTLKIASSLKRSAFYSTKTSTKRQIMNEMHCSVSYEKAIVALNNLQSNQETIERMRLVKELSPDTNVLHTLNCMERLGTKVSKLDSLNIIHVSGTKGKGSTCAFVESILRTHGFKTGFYSSPHLVQVRERIRINGDPLSEELFAHHFWRVYDILDMTKDAGAIPAYFKFLTVMAFEVFLAQKVDVAIIEVGIGGQHDCTNVIRNPVVCGVSTLDFDHQKLLGYTLPEIAWQKAGIFKPGSVAVTVDQCPLYLSPANLPVPSTPFRIGINGEHQLTNVSLALQLVALWMARRRAGFAIPFDPTAHPELSPISRRQLVCASRCYSLPVLPVPDLSRDEPLCRALANCRWPGRSQIITQTVPGSDQHRSHDNNTVTYFIDGAHTPKSMQLCANWFADESIRLATEQRVEPLRVLLFHCTGYRDPETLLNLLLQAPSPCFDLAIFCPSRAHDHMDLRSDQANKADIDLLMRRCEQTLICWLKLMARQQFTDTSAHLAAVSAGSPTTTSPTSSDSIISQPHHSSSTPPIAVVRSSVSAALKLIYGLGQCTHVLTTGSLHLVGALLANIDPKLECS